MVPNEIRVGGHSVINMVENCWFNESKDMLWEDRGGIRRKSSKQTGDLKERIKLPVF